MKFDIPLETIVCALIDGSDNRLHLITVLTLEELWMGFEFSQSHSCTPQAFPKLIALWMDYASIFSHPGSCIPSRVDLPVLAINWLDEY